MDCCSQKICVEIKTPNCQRCKLFEPTYQELQRRFPQFVYRVATFGVDEEAQTLATLYGIKSAPTFVVYGDNGDVAVVKQEELEEVLERNAD